MNKIGISSLLMLMVVTFTACQSDDGNVVEEGEVSEVDMMKPMDPAEKEMIEVMEQMDAMLPSKDEGMMEGDFASAAEADYLGELKDVDGGRVSGTVRSTYDDDKGAFVLVADFKNLPALEGTDFYEGWIVRKGIFFDVISMGKAVGNTNAYMSETDLTDHAFYVLTVEPDDGDPAPAKHVLEGTLKKK